MKTHYIMIKHTIYSDVLLITRAAENVRKNLTFGQIWTWNKSSHYELTSRFESNEESTSQREMSPSITDFDGV